MFNIFLVLHSSLMHTVLLKFRLVSRYPSAIFRSELGDVWTAHGSALGAAPLAMNASLTVFARIFPDQTPTHQKQLLDHFLSMAKKAIGVWAERGANADAAGNAQKGTLLANSSTSAVIWNVSAALLGLCREMLRRTTSGAGAALASPGAVPASSDGEDNSEVAAGTSGTGGAGSGTALAAESSEVALALSAELMAWPAPDVRRAVAESLGLLCRLEPDEFTDRTLAVLRGKFESREPIVTATAALTAACLHRAMGVWKATPFVPFMMANLHHLASQSQGSDDDTVRCWALHALAVAVECGGVSFAPYLQPTLALVYTHHVLQAGLPPAAAMAAPTGILSSSDEHESALVQSWRPIGVTSCLAHLVNALLGQLGPELADSDLRLRCLTLWAYVSRDLDSACQLESIQSAEQLLLWAPDALPITEFWPMLCAAASCPGHGTATGAGGAAVRRTAARLLRQRLELNPDWVAQLGLESKLLDWFDAETDADVALEWAGVLSTAVRLTAVTQPVRWLAAVKTVLLGGSSSGAPATKLPVSLPVGQYFVDTPSSCLTGPDSTSSSTETRRSYRFAARVLAADVLRRVLDMVRVAPLSPNPHFDASLSTRGGGSKTSGGSANNSTVVPLVSALHDVMTVTCRAAGDGGWVPLRITGLRALLAAVLAFGRVSEAPMPRDDDDEDDVPASKSRHRRVVERSPLLLDAYQAQVGAVLKSAFAADQATPAPLLRATACQVIVAMVSFGVGGADAASLRRLVDMVRLPVMHAPLQAADDNAWLNPIYASAARSVTRLAHLHSLAHLHATGNGWAHLVPTPLGVACALSAASAANASTHDVSPAPSNQQASAASAAVVLSVHAVADPNSAGLVELIEPHAAALVPLYAQAFIDWAVIASQPRRNAAQYRGTGALVLGADAVAVKPLLLRDMPVWLAGIAAGLPSATNPVAPALLAVLPGLAAGVAFLLQCVHAHWSGQDERGGEGDRRAVWQSLTDSVASEGPAASAGKPGSSSDSSSASSSLHRILVSAFMIVSHLVAPPLATALDGSGPMPPAKVQELLTLTLALLKCDD